jgi:hypothetical protein
MTNVLNGILNNAKLGDPQTFRNIVVYPITGGSSGRTPAYITLAEAMERQLLTVTELTEGGSVPELKVTNAADVPVLLLDGEELAGAKQNRVLNTSVLVPEKQSIVIPVSCTEQGRWHYTAHTFHDSGTVLPHGIRAHKSHSVSESLHGFHAFHSDQGEVWEAIAKLHSEANVHSHTHAMRDIYAAHDLPLGEGLKSFPLVEGQQGALVVIDGEPSAFDFVSLPSAFARLHGKLIKSYLMEVILGKTELTGVSASDDGTKQKAEAFLRQAAECEDTTFKSVGHGDDHRLKDSSMVGSALVHADAAVHMAFFRLVTASGHTSAFGRRRMYRATERSNDPPGTNQ